MMKQLFLSYQWHWVFLCMGLLYRCTLPYEFENEAYEQVLVVDGMLTNSNKKHILYISKAYAFGATPRPEEGARVWVEASDGTLHHFREKVGVGYQSVESFSALEQLSYVLHIETTEGQHIASKPMQLPPASELTGLVARPEVDDFETPGIGIYLDAQSQENAHLYRFEYEETYKVVAPRWSPYDAVVSFEGFATFETRVILRETQERVCYAFSPSEQIMLRSTLNQTTDQIEQEKILFLPVDSPKLQYRYSVLVRMLVENPDTYNYFETLKGLSAKSASFFTSIQPGYLAGNLFDVDRPEVKVAGFFRVSSEVEQRLFFSLADYYPNAPQPPYFYPCGYEAPTAEGPRGQRQLLNSIYSGRLRFYDYNRGELPGRGPYLMVSAACGDCTVMGSNKVPDFWVP